MKNNISKLVNNPHLNNVMFDSMTPSINKIEQS